MTVKVRFLNRQGDEPKELTIEEAQSLVEAKEGRYFVVDETTQKIIKECDIKDGQYLAFLPIVRGG